MRRAGIAAMAVGALALAAALVIGRGPRAIGAVAASWLLCAGLAAGGVAVSAAIQLSRGRWAASVSPVAESAAALLWPALGALAVLVAVAPLWMPHLGTGAWLALAARDLALGAALAAAGRRYVRDHDVRVAVAYVLLYVVTLSVWMIDLVMGLGPWAPSTVLPPFYFMGAFMGGFAWPTVLAAARLESSTRHDLGKLLFAFSIFWGYLLWAAYLPTWYGNLPEETGQLLARWHGGWWPLSLLAMVAVFAFPFVFLFPEGNKRDAGRLTFAAATILVGLTVTHVLMIVPTLAPRLDSGTALAIVAGALVPGAAMTLLRLETARP